MNVNLVYDLNLKAIKDADIDLFNALNETEDVNLEIVQSKTGHPIPKINGTFVHSAYDPIKEANTFINSHKSIIENQNVLLVMAHGFGYHVEVLAKLIKDNPEKYIFVIEPDLGLFKKSLQYHDITWMLDKVTFIVGYSIHDLFNIPGFYKILNVAPYTIGYRPAINVNKEYFEEFVARRSSNLVEHLVLEADEDEGLVNILNRFKQEETLDMRRVITSILDSEEPLSRAEKLFLVMGELSK